MRCIERWFASEGHVLPQYACDNRFSGPKMRAFEQKYDVFLRVRSKKGLRLCLDLFVSYPALSSEINGMCITSEKKEPVFPSHTI
jgi:hypothetical protein